MEKKKIYLWEPWFFIFFGIFHLHRIWGLADRNSYAEFWLGILENKGAIYFILMGVLASLCILGIVTFIKNRNNNSWWRWIYIFGGTYVIFDLFAIAVELKFWNNLLMMMFDVNSPYWNIIWSFFILLGGFVFMLGIVLFRQRKQNV
ncbi:MAG: hypothetical protein J6K17_12750 [Oscillospiraceae bacterium]|nr:hypothetical protein [Oscillospiraceae bacterium]